MSLRQHVAVLRSSALLILLSVAAAVVVSIVVTVIAPRSFEARATLSVGQPLSSQNVDYNDLLASQLLAKTYARLVSTGPLLEAAIARASLNMDEETLRNRIRTEVQAQDILIDIVVRDTDAEQAALIANALAAELLARTPQPAQPDVNSITQQISALDALIANLNGQIETLSSVDSPTEAQQAQLDVLTRRLDAVAASRGILEGQLPRSSPGTLVLIDPATVPIEPAGPGRSVVILLSALIALISSVGLAYAITAWQSEGGRAPAPGVNHQETKTRAPLTRLGKDRP
jgi:capsular polysaccharide biosynthesis protein